MSEEIVLHLNACGVQLNLRQAEIITIAGCQQLQKKDDKCGSTLQGILHHKERQANY